MYVVLYIIHMVYSLHHIKDMFYYNDEYVYAGYAKVN